MCVFGPLNGACVRIIPIANLRLSYAYKYSVLIKALPVQPRKWWNMKQFKFICALDIILELPFRIYLLLADIHFRLQLFSFLSHFKCLGQWKMPAIYQILGLNTKCDERWFLRYKLASWCSYWVLLFSLYHWTCEAKPNDNDSKPIVCSFGFSNQYKYE